MKEQILHTHKGNVFYWRSESWDSSKDTIFFLHGLTADHSMFDGQIEAFADDYNILTENVKKIKSLLCSGYFATKAIKQALDLLNKN